MRSSQQSALVLITGGKSKGRLAMMSGMSSEELLNSYSRNPHTGFFMSLVDEETMTTSIIDKVVIYSKDMEPLEYYEKPILMKC